MIQLAYASFLAGAAMIALPIILHLLKRKPTVPENFPSLRFLYATAARKQNRNNIIKWLLLLLRCLIFSLLALAFAWPYLSDIAEDVRSATVILFDRSMSMNAKEWGGSLPLEAKSRIVQADSVHPVLLGLVGETVEWSGKFTGDSSTLLRWFEDKKTSVGTSSFDLALLQADAQLMSINAANKKIVLITDGQQLPWNRLDYNRPLSSGVQLEVVMPTEKSFQNFAIKSVELLSAYRGRSAPLKLRIRLHNFSDKTINGSLNVFADGFVSGKNVAELTPYVDTDVLLELKPVKDSPGKKDAPITGHVSFHGVDDLIMDNTRYFVVNPTHAGDLMFTRTQGLDFIATALVPAAQISEDRYYKPQSGKLNSRVSLLVLQDLHSLKTGYEHEVINYVKNGGWAVICLSDDPESRSLAESFGITVGRKIDKMGFLGQVNFENELLATFREVKTGGWFTINFHKWLRLELPEASDVLMTFADGSPALAQVNAGKGRLYVTAFPLNRDWTDWGGNATFLPFWKELFNTAQRSNSEERVPAEIDAGNIPAVLPEGAVVYDLSGNNLMTGASFIPQRADCYLIAYDGRTQAVAVNPPFTESDSMMIGRSLRGLLKNVLKNENMPVEIVKKSDSERMGELAQSEGSHWWWWIMVAVAGLLMLELTLANRVVI